MDRQVQITDATVSTQVRVDPNALKPLIAKELAVMGITVADPDLIHIDEQSTIVLNVSARVRPPKGRPTTEQLTTQALHGLDVSEKTPGPTPNLNPPNNPHYRRANPLIDGPK